jgi:hypothetical protein
MRFVTEKDVVEFLLSKKGASFCNIATVTNPKKLLKVGKDGRKLPGRIKHYSIQNGMLGASYENVVNNQRERESLPRDFVPLSLWNGKGILINPYIAKHSESGRFYLVFYPCHDVGRKSWYVDFDNKRVVEDIDNWLPSKREGSKRQGTDIPVPWRIIAFESIRLIKAWNEQFVIARQR